MEINRRKFLSQAGLAGLASATSWPLSATERQTILPVTTKICK